MTLCDIHVLINVHVVFIVFLCSYMYDDKDGDNSDAICDTEKLINFLKRASQVIPKSKEPKFSTKF